MDKRRLMLAILVSGVFGLHAATGDTTNRTSVLRMPHLGTPPVLDGRIGTNEWQDAAAITGFSNFDPSGIGMSLPRFLQPVWFLGYDDQNVYMAFRYPVYPKGSLRARAKTKVQAENQLFTESVLSDDHTEIMICTGDRSTAISGSFFKFMTNPWDVISDQKVRYSIGQWGMEYETGAAAKSTFTDDYWEQELAIPLKSFDIATPRVGDKWIVQLVSAQDPGGNYWSWVNAAWLQFHLFPEVVLAGKAPAVQLLDVGDWMAGNPDFHFRIHNPLPQPATITLEATITAADGATLMQQSKPVTVAPAQTVEANLSAANLKLGAFVRRPTGSVENWVHLRVTDAAGMIFYDHRMPLRRMDSADVQGYVRNLADARKPAQPRLQFAYLPSFNRLKVSSDVGILGVDPKYRRDARYLTASFRPAGGDIVGRNSAAFGADGTADLTFTFAPLPEGAYEITMAIADAAGQALLSKTDTFERKVFPFESFRGGTAETLVRPYTALQTGPVHFETIGNRVTLTDEGLIKQISSKLLPAAAGTDLLAGPMQIVVWQNGQAQACAAKGTYAWTNRTADTRAAGQGTGGTAGLGLTIRSEAEYTGQYLVDLDLVPQGKQMVERVELQIPLSDPVDTASVFNPRDSMLIYTRETPWRGTPKPGIVWDNQSRRPVYPTILYVGNGERGLNWYTDSYEGFWLDRNRPHITIEKRASDTLLRIAFINKSVLLDHPRHIRFAFLPTPTKPLPPDARRMQWNSERMHIGGASWWGTTGCFVMPLNDQEWQDWIAGKSFTYKGRPTTGAFPVMPPPPRGPDGRALLEKGREYGAYRAADLIGPLQPEFPVFAGEWIDVTHPQLVPDAGLLRYQDKAGNPIWPEPEQRAVYLKDAGVQSFYDYESYYFYLNAKNAGIGGYWWDWNSMVEGQSLDKGTAYLNDEGKQEPRLNTFLVRSFYHRVARIAQEVGVPDCNNVYSPGVVYQMPWLTRINAWESMYLESELDDMFDAHGVDKYRTIIGKYSGIPVQIVMNIPMNLNERRARTVFALALLHDNGIFSMDTSKPTMDLLAKAGITDEQSEWVPYWRSAAVAKADKAGLLISAYRNPRNGLTTLVVVNPDKAAVEANVALGESGSSAHDLESGAVLAVKGREVRRVHVPAHDFRLIGIDR